MKSEESIAKRASAGGPSGGSAAASVGAGIFLSKVFGFVRERVFAHYFGASTFADAWYAALRMPNVIRNLLGEGTLSASMIPVYAELLEEGREDAAARFAGAALGILATVAAILVLVGMAVAPLVVPIFFPVWDPDTRELTVRLIRILLPMTGLFVLSAWALGILNSHRTFFVTFVAPVFWNLAMITAMVGGAVYVGLDDGALVEALAWGALVGGALTLLVQVPFLARHVGGMRISLGRGVEGVGEAIRNFVPVVAARGIVNVSAWIDLILAGRLMPGAVAVMGYAQTFANLPISLFGTGVAAAELPELSRMRQEHRQALTDRVTASLTRALYFLIPSAVVYVTLGDVVVGALYQTGAFDLPQTLVTWGVLAAYSLGLPASASSRVLSSAFYALRDTRTPAKMAYVRVGISVVVGVALMFPADRLGFSTLRLGAAGLAVGSATGAWVELLLLRRAMRGYVGAYGPGSSTILRLLLAALGSALVGVLLQVTVAAPPSGASWGPAVVALETLVPTGVVYLLVTRAMGFGTRGPSPRPPRRP